MTTTWIPGSDHGLVWVGGSALIDGSLATEVVVGLWRRFTGGVDMGGFLQALSEASGGNLLAIPPFAVVLQTPDGPQAACRGDFLIEAIGGSDTERVSGAGVTTWIERTFGEVTRVVIRRGEQADVGTGRPLWGGVVPATQLSLDQRDEAPGASGRRAEHAAARRGVDPLVVPPSILGVPVVGAVDGAGEPPAAPDEASAASDPASRNTATSTPGRFAESETLIFEDPDQMAVGLAESEALAREFDGLFGETVLHPIEDAAVRPPEDEPVASGGVAATPRPVPSSSVPVNPTPAPVIPEPPPAQHAVDGFISSVPRIAHDPEPGFAAAAGLLDLGDHDGMTIMQVDFDEPAPAAPPNPVMSGETVVALMCAQGHPNPPQRTTCRVCHAVVGGTPTRIPRPSLGWLRTSSGEEIELVTAVIAGRSPHAERVQGPVLPRLLALPHGHISGNHVEIRLQGWNVLAVDLHSRNGTFLRRRGEPPVRLPEQPTLLVADDVLDLGHGVQLSFEELP